MSTSGTYSFTITRDDIIRDALLGIGKLAGDEQPEAADTQDCARKLNMMCKQWMGKGDFAPGLKVWTRKRGHLFLSNSTGQYSVGPTATGWTNSYTTTTATAASAAGASVVNVASINGIAASNYIGIQMSDGSLFWTTVSSMASLAVTVASTFPVAVNSGAQIFCYATTAQQPLNIEAVVLRDIYNVDIPVRILPTTQDYDILPNKVDPTNASDPGAIFYETQLGNANLYIDAGAAQDVTKHLVLTYMEPVQDFNNPLDNAYYPQEWFLPLCLGLGKQVAPMYNKPWTPLMQENYREALAIAQHKDAEQTSMFFQPGSDS